MTNISAETIQQFADDYAAPAAEAWNKLVAAVTAQLPKTAQHTPPTDTTSGDAVSAYVAYRYALDRAQAAHGDLSFTALIKAEAEYNESAKKFGHLRNQLDQAVGQLNRYHAAKNPPTSETATRLEEELAAANHALNEYAKEVGSERHRADNDSSSPHITSYIDKPRASQHRLPQNLGAPKHETFESALTAIIKQHI